MEKSKILYVSQAIMPYLSESEIGRICRILPQGILEKGKEIRTFMPRFGNINERRNQLQEVIRLSGLNIIIDDTDHPLIIKVASIQQARMQIYFIDNDDFFHRKSDVYDASGADQPDNDERAIFFARGVLETTLKLRWAPDIIHCHGWFTSFIVLFIRLLMKDDPHFANSKIVMSIYDNGFPGKWDGRLKKKLFVEGIDKKALNKIDVDDYQSLCKMVIDMSDGIVQGSKDIDADVLAYAQASGKPFLPYTAEDQLVEACNTFYDTIRK